MGLLAVGTPYQVASCLFMILLFGVLAFITAQRMPEDQRSWVMLAFVEYMVCGGAQLLYTRVFYNGGDAIFYVEEGAQIANLIDYQWKPWAGETLSLLVQQSSAFDNLLMGSQTNTGSMTAFAAWLVYFSRGATYAPTFLSAGLAYFGSLAIYKAFREVAPDAPFLTVFVPTVLFPSVAFWTASLHKETLAIVGIGLALTAWRAFYNARFVRGVFFAAPGLALIILFRAPALPPLLLGLGIFVLLERMQKTRGPDAVLLGPVYLGLVIAMLAGGAFAITQALPGMGIENLGDQIAAQQRNWAFTKATATSSLDMDDTPPDSLGGQVTRIPLALVNALFRPQLFDVHNIGTALSAVEMTVLLVLLLNALRKNGPAKLFARVWRSPLLIMCLTTTFIGCGLVGLVTFNLGSLARYRVPFLPFYGLFISILSLRPSETAVPAPKKPAGPSDRRPRPLVAPSLAPAKRMRMPRPL